MNQNIAVNHFVHRDVCTNNTGRTFFLFIQFNFYPEVSC